MFIVHKNNSNLKKMIFEILYKYYMVVKLHIMFYCY